jgi:general secretion pathway protein G
MIELIFVIVILGILAAVAIPRLAATRDDAKAASIKTDIGTVLQAVPAWYAGQQEVSIVNAMQLDTNVWRNSSTTSYTYNDGPGGSGGGTANIKIVYLTEQESTGPVAINTAISTGAAALNATSGAAIAPDPATNRTVPWLAITLAPANTGIVKTLVNDLGVSNITAIAIAGRRVNW